MATFTGTAGADGETGSYDVMYGLDGNDTLTSSGSGQVFIYGGQGADLITFQFQGQGNGHLYGDDGNDIIFGGRFADTIYGGDGQDTMSGGTGGDYMEGGAGADSLSGDDDSDTLEGGAGEDTLDGGAGADIMSGGLDGDVYIVDDALDRVIETTGAGFDSVRTSVSYVLGSGQEIEILETLNPSLTTALQLTGNEFAQTIFGNDGANVIDGRGGADAMIGNGGSDTYIVDNDGDQVVEAANGGTDSVRSSVSFTLSDNVENLTLIGNTAEMAVGNALANQIAGTNRANSLNGLTGADTMTGFGGNDLYFVDSSGDVIVEAANGGIDRVRASVSHALAANVEDLTLTNSAISGIGNALANTIAGTNGSNIIDGGLGDDTLTGAGGADRFSFTTALGANNVDTITDFEAAGTVDSIRLENAVFVGLPTGALAASAFVVSNKAQDGSDRIIYNSNTGDLFFDRDGNGGQFSAVKFAILDAGLPMTAADFMVI